jgi:hypothetical protein
VRRTHGRICGSDDGHQMEPIAMINLILSVHTVGRKGNHMRTFGFQTFI